ncbi:MAG: sensor histidine kinase [Planctomycetaceae bacterium]
MSRPHHIWLSYAACLALAAGAVGWLSFRALDSERAEATARSQALLEENVRLALWRIDSALAPFLAQENSRPFDAYFTDRTGVLTEAPQRQWPVQIRLSFSIDPQGRFNSPQAEPATSERLTQLERLTRRDDLLATIPPPAPSPFGSPLRPAPIPESANGVAQADRAQQKSRADSEFVARSQLLSQNNRLAIANSAFMNVTAEQSALMSARVGSLVPLVRGGHLLLVRRGELLGDVLVQGLWLNWDVLKTELLTQITDLLPHARLEIVDAESVLHDQGRSLAALPVRLDPGPFLELSPATFSPVRVALIAGWGGLVVAALAVAGLLRGILVLSERRADFVSAVTHELRTPLTTFRMYTDLLADESVVDELQRRDYLGTLQREARRLAHLVDNVLAYARLERGGLGNRVRGLSVEMLLAAVTDRLGERAIQVGLRLGVEAPDSVRRLAVRADPSAVEQILFNLVDNACKYAGVADKHSGATDEPAGNGAIRLTATATESRLQLRVRDCGPGIPGDRRRHLFQPFCKSSDDAAQSAPGVGLGLALCRRLARDMGGDLWLDADVSDGAAFVLELPLAQHPD